MPVTVRAATPADHEAVAALTVAVYVDEGYDDGGYAPQLGDVASRVASATVLIAEDDGRLLGAVTAVTRGGPWANQAAAGEAEIRMLAVAPDARGRGVGEVLTRACLDQAREDGCTLVRLSSQESMQAAHRLYARLGFVRTPSRDWAPTPGLLLRAYAMPLVPWCDQCGRELAGEGHQTCARAATLDPPRYCAHCRRRMVVQVTPGGWTARCVEHGIRTG